MNAGDYRSATFNRYCSFNVQPGRYLHVTIDGVRSNTIRMSGEPVNPSQPPGAPSLSVRLDTSSGDRNLVASWSPPTDNGGSRITGYTVTWSRPGRTWTPDNVGASARTDTLRRPRSNTTYTVRVVARNSEGTGPAAVRQITTPGRTTTTTTSPSVSSRQTTDRILFDAVPMTTPPYTGTVIGEVIHSWSSGWQRMDDDCGLFRCKDHYYLGGGRDIRATWFMGDLQGVFTFWWKNPVDSVANLTGNPIWRIYEKAHWK